MSHPPLPDGVGTLPGIDVEPLWEQFRVFEALHHGMGVMNPMSSEDLDAVLDALAVADDDRVLDLGCGHGELLMRLAGRHRIDGLGIDLSPWQLARAAERTARLRLVGKLSWLLGSASEAPDEPAWDVVTCLGASWIWNGFEGTVQALARRCRPGGRLAIGDLQRRQGTDPHDVPPDYRGALTAGEQADALVRAGVTPLLEVDPGLDGWLDYDRRTEESARAYADGHPGEQAEGFLAEQRRWVEEHREAVVAMGWTVWVGRVEEG